MNKNVIIGGIIAVAVAGAIVYSVYQTAMAPGGDGPATTTPQATSTPPKPVPQTKGPTIPTTPYTVYLGLATEHGTSSEELMKQEGSQVAVGYEWESIAPSAMFDSVVLPQWGSAEAQYEVQVWDQEKGEYIVLGKYPSGIEVQFPRNQLMGPWKFKVLGIDPSQRVCPGDRSFNWSARFTYQAPLSVVRTPITQDLLLFKCQMR